jgi:hypothetical protein
MILFKYNLYKGLMLTISIGVSSKTGMPADEVYLFLDFHIA